MKMLNVFWVIQKRKLKILVVVDVQKYKEIIDRLENGYKPNLEELLD